MYESIVALITDFLKQEQGTNVSPWQEQPIKQEEILVQKVAPPSISASPEKRFAEVLNNLFESCSEDLSLDKTYPRSTKLTNLITKLFEIINGTPFRYKEKIEELVKSVYGEFNRSKLEENEFNFCNSSFDKEIYKKVLVFLESYFIAQDLYSTNKEKLLKLDSLDQKALSQMLMKKKAITLPIKESLKKVLEPTKEKLKFDQAFQQEQQILEADDFIYFVSFNKALSKKSPQEIEALKTQVKALLELKSLEPLVDYYFQMVLLVDEVNNENRKPKNPIIEEPRPLAPRPAQSSKSQKQPQAEEFEDVLIEDPDSPLVEQTAAPSPSAQPAQNLTTTAKNAFSRVASIFRTKR